MSKKYWLLAFPLAILVMVINVAIHVLFMVFYGNFFNPNQPTTFYQEFAEQTAPYSSILAGMPLMFIAGYFFGKRFESQNRVKAALLIWLIYFIIDFTVILLAGELFNIFVLFVISFTTKFIGAYFGGKFAQKQDS